jgi:hypothetical protein
MAGGAWRLVVVLAVAAAGVLAVGAHAAFAQGTLEICKSSANGMSSRSFQFSVTGGSTITVKGGRCSGPFTVPHGTVTITELATTPATEVDSIVVRPSQRNLGLSGNTAQVNVPAGSTTSNETRITFTNIPAGGTFGDLKICKLTDTPAFVGHLYTFHVNGGPGISVEANSNADDPSAWSCRLAGSFLTGTVVSVKEDTPFGQELAFIDANPADRLLDFDTNSGVAHYLIGPGVTVALFDNEARPPSGTGFIEVCKDAASVGYNTPDPAVTGPFDFTIDEQDSSSQDITLLAGQCSSPIPVAAGVVRVTEHARAGIGLVNVFTIPNDRLLDSNLINRTADVEVPVSADPADESQVHFVNGAQRGQLKVCKALGANSSVLNGMVFAFIVDPTPNVTGSNDDFTVRITALAGTTQCKIADDFPTGSTVTVEEQLAFPAGAYIQASGPGCGYNAEGNLECSVTIGSGVTTLTITNKAVGKLEICKFITGRAATGTEASKQFSFKIDGGATIKVRQGTCSPPQLVTIGSHAVTETAETNYELDSDGSGNGIVVTPPEAEVSRNLLARSVTVNVPWAGDPNQIGKEVRVDYYNRRKTAEIKVCKHVSPGSTDALGSKDFYFNVYVNGTFYNTIRDVGAEECKLLLDPATGQVAEIPVNQPNGSATIIGILEAGGATAPPYHVSALSLQGGRSTPAISCVAGFCNAYSGAGGSIVHIQWNPGPGTNTAHFTNTANDP